MVCWAGVSTRRFNTILYKKSLLTISWENNANSFSCFSCWIVATEFLNLVSWASYCCDNLIVSLSLNSSLSFFSCCKVVTDCFNKWFNVVTCFSYCWEDVSISLLWRRMSFFSFDFNSSILSSSDLIFDCKVSFSSFCASLRLESPLLALTISSIFCKKLEYVWD